MTLDHFVMVRIHARQPVQDELLMVTDREQFQSGCGQIVANFIRIPQREAFASLEFSEPS